MNEVEGRRLAVICPVFNEEASLPIFFQRIAKVREQVGAVDLQLFFIDNGCVDSSYAQIVSFCERHAWVHVISLSRNFGYQGAVICGMREISADGYLIIDADCEDPPELAPTFVAHWLEGFDVVYGERRNRPENEAIRWGRLLFYRLTKLIADSDFILDMAEFALISRRVRDAVVATRSTHPFVRNEIAYAGFRRKAVAYDREPRVAGRTHYNLFRMARFAIAGILTSSTYLLRLWGYVVPLLVLVNVAVAFGFGHSDRAVRALLLIDLSCILTMAMLIGLYVARIYKDQIARPIYIVDELKTRALSAGDSSLV